MKGSNAPYDHGAEITAAFLLILLRFGAGEALGFPAREERLECGDDVGVFHEVAPDFVDPRAGFIPPRARVGNGLGICRRSRSRPCTGAQPFGQPVMWMMISSPERPRPHVGMDGQAVLARRMTVT